MSKKALKGQGGLEFIMAFGFLMMVLLMASLISIQKTQDSADLKTAMDAKRVGTSIKDNLDTIAQQGPGYYRYFSIPRSLQGGYDYDVRIEGNVIEISYEQNSWSAYLISSNITYNCLTKGYLRKNRVKYEPWGLTLNCHLPNLKADDASYFQEGNWSYLEIVNDAHVPSEGFMVFYDTNASHLNFTVGGMAPYQRVTAAFNISGADYLKVIIDYMDFVNETTKADNNYSFRVDA